MIKILKDINGNKTYYVVIAAVLTYGGMGTGHLNPEYFWVATGVISSLLAGCFRSALKKLEPGTVVDETPVEAPVSISSAPADIGALVTLVEKLLNDKTQK